MQDEPVIFDEDEETDEQRLSRLVSIVEVAGEEALTEDEYTWLQSLAQQQQPKNDGHYSNLALNIEESELKKLAQQVLAWVEADEESREEWQNKEREGIRRLGVSPNTDGGASFKGASRAVHPALAEACVQFAARTLGVLWPSGGPAKAVVLGQKTVEREEQANRVAGFLNYQYTQMMRGAFEQTDSLLVRLPLSGSCFIKVYADPIDGVTRRFVEPADFIVPYLASDLDTASRYTERVMMADNDVKKRQSAGMYRDIALLKASENSGSETRNIVIDEIKETEGREDTKALPMDDRRTLYECYCYLDLVGFKDKREDGNETGIALPYVVTVDKDTQNVLSIYRGWKESDQQKRRVIHHIHYRFMPGLGFYGYGFYHWISGLTNAATGALRALLDAALLSNLPGGYRSKDVGLKNGTTIIGPGEWVDCDASAEELQKAFFKIPYGEPSAVLFNLLSHIEQMVQRFAGTTETMVGAGNENTPVGTTLARIEQGSRVQTAIQTRLHAAQTKELQLVAWLDSIYLPQEYPYAIEGEDRSVFRDDFDDRIDIVPVSDPAFVSNMQRFFVSQASLEIAASAPHLYDMKALHRRAQASLQIQNIDEILPPDEDVKRMGPVEESAAIMLDKPVKAFIEQNHQAHIVIHQAAIANMDQNGPQAGAMMAHIQEHVAMSYVMEMQMMTGQMFAMPDDERQELPVEIENQLAMLAAQAVQQMQQSQPDPTQAQIEADQQRKDAIAARDQSRKDMIAQRDADRKDAVVAADIHRHKTVAAIHPGQFIPQ